MDHFKLKKENIYFEDHKKSLYITRLQVCPVPEHLHHPSHHAGPKHISQDEVSQIQLVLEILTCNLHWLSKCSILKNLQSTPPSSAQKIFNSLWSRFLQFKKSHCQVTVEMCTPWSPGNYWHENLEPRHKALGSSRKWKQLLPGIMQLEVEESENKIESAELHHKCSCLRPPLSHQVALAPATSDGLCCPLTSCQSWDLCSCAGGHTPAPAVLTLQVAVFWSQHQETLSCKHQYGVSLPTLHHQPYIHDLYYG